MPAELMMMMLFILLFQKQTPYTFEIALGA